mmetsp:Transcript_18905/g.44304  ORF Transcript_18905/g.44304 Transcript_18905/m.44304 type:complete len:327 (-) Transcript_18905:13-993(-)
MCSVSQETKADSTVELSFLEKRAFNDLSPSVVIFLHGVGSSKETWGDVLHSQELASLHIFAVDLRGHGETESGNEDFSTQQHVADLHRFITERALTRVFLVGHSMGARVAIPYAAQHPSSVAGLIISDMDLMARRKFPDCPQLRSFSRWQPDEASCRAHLATVYNSAEIDSLFDGGRVRPKGDQWHIGIHPWATVQCQRALLASDDAETAFRKLRTVPLPVILLRAGKDSAESECVTRCGLDQMNAYLPRLQNMYFPEAVHRIYKSHPREYCEAILSFVVEATNGGGSVDVEAPIDDKRVDAVPTGFDFLLNGTWSAEQACNEEAN